MHEARIVAAILKEVEAAARKNGARRVTAVRLRMNPDGRHAPAALKDHLTLAAAGTAAEGAAFEIEVASGPLQTGGPGDVFVDSIRLPAERRLRLRAYGAVQGVGFRPFVHRLATELGLSGWVRNGPDGLLVEAEGEEDVLRTFEARLAAEKPAPAVVAGVETAWLEPAGVTGFRIVESETAGSGSAWVLPDLATCPDCLAETLDPSARRHLYPFTNCTLCGPRFTIVEALPYDRARTSMAGFPLCLDCSAEYGDPADRRFHAEPIACPACGPKVWLERPATRTDAARPEGPAALEAAARVIESGGVVAMKGLGGFLLFCDALSSQAVRRLRERKRRQEKPFALMFPSLGSVRTACRLGPQEEAWLLSPAAPIVLLRRTPGTPVAPEVAPGSAWLGALLPSTPLHHLWMRRLDRPLVATSGNVSEEPLAASNEEARLKLAGIADAFLMHDRPIARRADDSIVRSSRGRQSVLRRARGLAPLPLSVPGPLRPVLALGAHLKSTVSIAWGSRVVTSAHLGDLETGPGRDVFKRAAEDLLRLHGVEPEAVACDLHPGYFSTFHAESLGLPLLRVQHHHAHIAACMAEQDVPPPVLGIAWDGLGLGPDGTLWGGEFLRVDESGYARLGHLRTFPLPGGTAAVREGRRAALGLLSAGGFDRERLRARFGPEWHGLDRLVGSKLSPPTSSVGRLFDAVASLAGVAQANSFEGQAAMALEQAAEAAGDRGAYPFPLRPGLPAVADWAPLVAAVLEDADKGTDAGVIASRFHAALAALIVEAAGRFGLERVVLSGGVFQNARLTEAACAGLEAAGFNVFTPQRLPPNDGGISAGQAWLAGLGWGLSACPARAEGAGLSAAPGPSGSDARGPARSGA